MNESGDVKIIVKRHDPDESRPLGRTHHWHARAWVGGRRIESVWCYTRGSAMDEVLGALAAEGVELEPDLEGDR